MPGYENFFGRDELADVDVMLVEEDDEADTESTESRKRPRREELVLPSHKIVLCACSEVLNAQILNWQLSTSAEHGRQQVQLAVPKGQLEVGHLLLRSMYQTQPNLRSTDHATLLQLLVLADRYSAKDVVTAVGQAFKEVAAENLPWETVLQVYTLPAVCAQNSAAFASVFSAAAAKLQHELGDLELVFADKESSKLLDLPHAALLQLLRDPGTRVASENTAAHAVLEWSRSNSVNLTAARALVAEVRMCRCSHMYILSVLMENEAFVACCGSRELRLAAVCSSENLFEEAGFCRLLKQYPSWVAKERPASAMRWLVIEWSVPLPELQEAVQKLLATGTKQRLTGATRMWRGHRVTVSMGIRRGSAAALLPGGAAEAEGDDNNDNAAMSIDSYGRCIASGNDIFRMRSRLDVLKAPVDGISAIHSRVHLSGQRVFAQTVQAFSGRLLPVMSVCSWAEVEATLCSESLVHPDGCLHLTLTVTEPDANLRMLMA